MQQITVSIHSMVALITNSSTEMFTITHDGTLDAMKKLIDTVLKAANSPQTADGLFEFSFVPDMGFVDYMLGEWEEGDIKRNMWGDNGADVDDAIQAFVTAVDALNTGDYWKDHPEIVQLAVAAAQEYNTTGLGGGSAYHAVIKARPGVVVAADLFTLVESIFEHSDREYQWGYSG